MPYIYQERRAELYSLLDDIPVNAGELNFVLTAVCKQYFEENGGRYQQINDILGALEGAKLEFYRRVAIPYEEKKISEHGDVY